MNDELIQAKQMFFEFSCSKFFMWKEGALEEYEAFGISEEQEQAWRNERAAYFISRIPEDVNEACFALSSMHATEALPDLQRLAIEGDSFVQVMCADAIWHIANGQRGSGPDPEDIPYLRFAKDIWQSILDHPIRLTREYPEHYYRYIHAQDTEGYVRGLASDRLQYYATVEPKWPELMQEHQQSEERWQKFQHRKKEFRELRERFEKAFDEKNVSVIVGCILRSIYLKAQARFRR